MANRQPTTRSNSRHLAVLLAGFVSTFLAGDYVLSMVRLPHVDGSTNQIRWKWDLLADIDRVPDVVFMGCSFELCGIAPGVVEASTTRMTGEPVRSLNLAASASSHVTEYLLARRMVESGRLPRIAYIGVTPSAADVSLYTWLRGGLRAFGELRDIPLASRGDARLLAETATASAFRSYHQWNDVRIIAKRLVIGAPILSPTELRVDDQGWAEWLGPMADRVDSPADHDAPRDVRLRDPARIRIDNINGIAARRMIDMLRREGVEIRLIELPITSAADPTANPRYNLSYQEFLRDLVSETGAIVVRPPDGLLSDDDYFDHDHLGPGGAAKLSQWLAGDVAAALARANHRKPDGDHAPSLVLSAAESAATTSPQ